MPAATATPAASSALAAVGCGTAGPSDVLAVASSALPPRTTSTAVSITSVVTIVATGVPGAIRRISTTFAASPA